ncbi:hypothetical protein ABXT06_10770 [Flavobacterium sp. UW10123]
MNSSIETISTFLSDLTGFKTC